MSLDRKSLLTRGLHLLLLTAVIHQLVISNFMVTPRPGRPENLAFEFHEYIGLATFGLLFVYWIWTVIRTREARIASLVPWFSPTAMKAVAVDFRAHLSAWKHGRLPEVGARPFPIAIHGLGLLAVSAMALTGTMSLIDLVPETVRSAGLSIHELVSKAVWAYLVGHVSLALLHELLGHRLLRRMFWPS